MNNPRTEYMRTDGFALFTDVGHRLAAMEQQAVVPQPIELAPDRQESWRVADNHSAANLGIVTNDLAKQLGFLVSDRGSLYERHGVTQEDLAKQENLDIHKHGFSDLDTTWLLGAATANLVMAEYELEGHIAPTDRAQMTLGDYAAILESEWFGRVMEDMALTRNGAYGSTGRFGSDYNYKTVMAEDLPFKQVDRLFTFGGDAQVEGRRPPLSSATVSDQFRRQLRADMHEGKSSGCPVARHHGTLSTELAQTDPHVQSLIAAGRLAIIGNDGSNARFAQEQTPIGAQLTVLANHLRSYEAQYGAELNFLRN